MQLRRSSRTLVQQEVNMSSESRTETIKAESGSNENVSPEGGECIGEDVNGSDSDAGSDIFMPGGITMKTTEISDNIPSSIEEENQCDIKKEVCEEKDNEEDQKDDCAKIILDENFSYDIKVESNDKVDCDDEDSNSSCLQINTDTPEEDCEKTDCKEDIKDTESNMKDSDEKHILEERNIFNNPEIFTENHQKKSDDGDCDDDDEHNMSDDFKIGQEEIDYIKEEDDDQHSQPPLYEDIESNLYLIDKKKSRLSKEVRRMVCECPYEPDDPSFVGCDEDCLNRLLMIECHNRCPTGEFCTNRNFQQGCKYDLEVFKAGRKGWGLKTHEPIQKGAFIIEYCGEVVDYNEFHNRTLQYDAEKMSHYYFMTLKTNEIIDATKKGCKSRFINHSCDPNSVTQKWTVNGFLRVGFFALRNIAAGTELSFDYQFQRYGEKPQSCYCGATNCRGVIGTEQTNSFPSYMEKMISDSPSMSSKQKKRKKQMKQFYDSALADELNELLGTKWELRESKHSLELLRLMVKVETLHERKELLKILQASKDVSALKAFVRYKGLSLLWSWMVDASEDKHRYKVEILKTLQHLPVSNKNELDDSKLSAIVIKWANSKQEAVKRESGSDDDSQSPSDNEIKNDEGGSTSQDESSKEDDAEEKKGNTSLEAESMEEGEIMETDDGSSDNKLKKKDKVTRKKERLDARKREIATISASLLEDWKSLKEVFRIPKKSQTPDRRQKVESDESPIPDEKKLNIKGMDSPIPATTATPTPSSTPTSKTMLPDTTFRSPPTKQRQVQLHKGIGAFLTHSTVTEAASSDSHPSSDRRSEHSPNMNNEQNGRRDWRKSPTSSADKVEHPCHNSDSSDRSITADSTNREEAVADTTWSGGNDSREKKRDNRWSRNRRRSYDNTEWNDRESENHSGGENERHRGGWDSHNQGWNRWNDRMDRGGRHAKERHYQSGSDDNSENSWRKQAHDYFDPSKNMQQHWQFSNMNNNSNMASNMRPNMIPVMMNRMPNRMSNQMRMPIFAGNSGMMNQQANQMLSQHPVTRNMPNMFPSNPIPPRPPVNPQINTMMANQLPHSSPLVSPMSATSYNTTPVPPSKPMGQFPSPVQPEVSALNVVNQLQLLLNAERLKQVQELSTSQQGTPDPNRSSTSGSNSPTRPKQPVVLPPHWKTATDSEGRMYYYHAITRETSWDPPIKVEEDMKDTDKDVNPSKKMKKRHSVDDPRSPPSTIAAADTTHHHHGPRTPPGPHSSHSSTNSHKIKEAFKAKMSSVVVNCLNAYQKVDCKQGRIKNIDDFKFLARKLTHGLIMKEIHRIKDEERLICNDSVKVKVKEYIRNYMRKFGSCYVRS